MENLNDSMSSASINETSTQSDGTAAPICIVPSCAHPINLVLRASDGKRFAAHAELLDLYSSCFPPAECVQGIEETDLSESAEILDMLLRFMHPHPQPDITNLPRPTLEDLAEAVEKYQIYPAMQVCKNEMRRTVYDRPVEVLKYSMKHSYKDLRDEAVFYTVETPIEIVWNIMKDSNPIFFCAWTLFCHKLREKNLQGRYEQAVNAGRDQANRHVVPACSDHWRRFSDRVIDLLRGRHWKPFYVSFDLAAEHARLNLDYCHRCSHREREDSALAIWRRSLDALRREVSLDDWY
ncbi:hypothetical protein Moror_5572 [Moniliophthora roreri MCA 2997]|uniref:BTB domain-containing protein n=2 Tax=Moniliophthora roreri TaxID=221103 RepID=V2X5T8_MONRO|nr:hypothetical protein Moror_5572 [Moniliophthora roreri MCA 2997]KAI3614919.1 hypothetical protein WG66_016744 [Moniliophthora roreri]